MNNQPFAKPPRWWSPKINPRWVRIWRLVRLREQLAGQRLVDIEVNGVEHVQAATARGDGVLITPNHASHADCFSLYGASDALGMPFYVMVAWQVFQRSNWLRQLVMRHHGCFSVDREGMDMSAIRQAREVLQAGPYPLVIFVEFYGHTSSGTLPERIGALVEFLLARAEARYGITGGATTVPERVKAARREIIRRLEEMPAEAPEIEQLINDLDDMFLVVQAYSYPGNYVAQQPSIERIAETLDKFEEDILGVKTARVRAERTVHVVFGEPISVVTDGGARMSVSSLTNLLEQRVQELLDAQVAATSADAPPLARRAAV